MKNLIELVRLVRSSNTRQEDRALVLATLSDVAQIWRERRSLLAYHVMVCALDSNDAEVRRFAEESLNRQSPHPAKPRMNLPRADLIKSQHLKDSA